MASRLALTGSSSTSTSRATASSSSTTMRRSIARPTRAVRSRSGRPTSSRAIDAGYWFRATGQGGARVSVARPGARHSAASRRACPISGHPADHRAESESARARDAGCRRGPRRRRGRAGLVRILRLARAEYRRGDYEPRIPTGASREEARLALYRSWIRWPSPACRRTASSSFRSVRARRRSSRRGSSNMRTAPACPFTCGR